MRFLMILASRRDHGLEVIKLEYRPRLKIKRNDWLLACKQPIIALYFESENELKFNNLEACPCHCSNEAYPLISVTVTVNMHKYKRKVIYILTKVILWKHRIHQRPESAACSSFLDQNSYIGHLGLISDPLIVLKFYNGIHDPK